MIVHPLAKINCGALPRRPASPSAMAMVVAFPILLASAARGAEGRPAIEVSPRALDLGSLGHDETGRGEITVRNAGDAPLRVLEIRPSCSCIRVEPPGREPIAPGESRKFRVAMSSGRAIGSLAKHVEIRSDDPRTPRVEVALRLHVLEGFQLEPRELRFTGIVGGAPTTASFEITRPAAPAAGDPPFRLDAGEFRVRYGASRPGHFRADAKPIPRGYRVTVTLDPTHPEGRIQADYVTRVDGKPLQVPIAGEMFAWIVVAPTFLGFSGADPARPETMEREFRLRSTDDRAFRILAVEQEPSERGGPRQAGVKLDFSVSSAPSGLVHRIGVRIRVEGSDVPHGSSFFGKVLVRTDHPEKPELRVTYSGFFPK